MGHVARPASSAGRADAWVSFDTSSAVANESYIAFVWSSASWMRARHLSNSDC